MKPAERDHLHALLSALVEGTIDELQAAELAGLLEADADARRFYVRYLDMHAALASAAVRPPAAGCSRFPWVAVIASLLAASVLLAWFAVPAGRPVGPPATAPAADIVATDAVAPGYVATITSASADAVLNGEPAGAATRLTPGPYAIAAGSVTVQFDGGARVLFDGQARFTLRSRRAMTIERGTFVFEGDQSCETIEIVTPHSVFRNIGTRYAAVIAADAEEVHVAEGAVRRTSGQGARPARHELIEAGVGRRFAAADAGAESIPLDAALVERSLDAASARVGADRPLVVDGFRGDQEQFRGLRSGRGWAEPWRSGHGDWRLIAPGLSGAGSAALLHDGSGGTGERHRAAAHRRLETPIDLSQDGIWYLRFLVRRDPVGTKDEHQAMVVLRTHGLSTQEEIDRGTLIQVALRRDDVAMIRLAGTLTRVSLPQVPGQTYAVITKIVAGRDRPEQVLVRVMAADQLTDSKEPEDWSLVSESVPTDIRIDQVSLECVSGGRIEFGDLCIGSTWESVAGPTVGP
jgi:hypothetical protein